jgi:lysophospholipase L1-like esterase
MLSIVGRLLPPQGQKASAMSIRTILCYGDSNTHGTAPMPAAFHDERFARELRWPGVLQTMLGAGWLVIEEGLPGRTTAHDDPIEGAHKNGVTYLKPCLESHRPIDVLAIMLGTNDLKARFSVPAMDIALGVDLLCRTALASAAGPAAGAPKLLIVAPVPILEAAWLAEMFEGGEAKSRRLAPLYQEVAERHGAAFFDAGSVASCCTVDGIHLEADQHRRIGKAMAQVVMGFRLAS